MNLWKVILQREFTALILACLVILSACSDPGKPTAQSQSTFVSTRTILVDSITATESTTITSSSTPSKQQITNTPPFTTVTPGQTSTIPPEEPPRGRPCLSKDNGELVPTPIIPTVSTTSQPSLTPTLLANLGTLSNRAGFGMATSAIPEQWAATLGSGWFLTWRVLERSPQQIPEHWQTIRVGKGCVYPSLDFIGWAAAIYPGSVWIVGNEPDVIWQDNVMPEEFAHLYHDVYQTLKTADSSAKVAVGAISEPTSLRLAYLERVLNEYQARYGSMLPADWWTVHGYVLREQRNSWGVEIPPGFTEDQGMLWEVSDHGRLDLFKDLLIHFREWMASHGYQNTPLALTEFGILMPPDYGYPLEQVAKYMQDTFHWLQDTRNLVNGYPGDDYKLVQRWAWFSLSYDLYPAPNLADLTTNQLTLLGKTFKDYIFNFHP
jgi:hypothetical protein